MRLAIIAGEASGDLLGADLVAALKSDFGVDIELIGVGGPALEAEGLNSLFDFSQLSIMGLSAVLARLPGLIRRIYQTANAIIKARPDALLIIDSPDFTHRVAHLVKRALPRLPVVQYVCPSVWAWKEHRASEMTAYIDLVLAILPFEPDVMTRLRGPETRFIGHRLTSLPDRIKARQSNQSRWAQSSPLRPTILLLPGSRSSEVGRLLPVFLKSAEFLHQRGIYRFLMPTVASQERAIRSEVAKHSFPIEVILGEAEKWAAFGEADAAIAASGTVLLELALAGVPVVSAYKTDWLIGLMLRRLKIWTAALPNLIADYPVVPEFFNQMARPELLGRWAGRLAAQTPERQAALQGFSLVEAAMITEAPSGHQGAYLLLERISNQKARP